MEVKQTTKIIMCWELFEQNVPKAHIAKRLEVNRYTVYEWLGGIKDNTDGLLGFLDDYEKAKKKERAIFY